MMKIGREKIAAAGLLAANVLIVNNPQSGLGITARNLLMFSLMLLFILVINTL